MKIRTFLYEPYKNIRKLVWRDVPVPVVSVVLVKEAAVGLVEYQFDRAGRAVTVFCQDYLYLVLLFLCPFGIILTVAAHIVILTVEERDDIRILLDGA